MRGRCGGKRGRGRGLCGLGEGWFSFVQCFEDRVPIPLEASCLTNGLRSELFCAFVAAIVSVVLERYKLAYSCCVAEGTFS